ncbi:hypothetical protein GPALN_014707 [Globodera pallida]|nr:hypothetical protein GPALN_014707 [Globodera pallida]
MIGIGGAEFAEIWLAFCKVLAAAVAVCLGGREGERVLLQLHPFVVAVAAAAVNGSRECTNSEHYVIWSDFFVSMLSCTTPLGGESRAEHNGMKGRRLEELEAERKRKRNREGEKRSKEE